MRNMLIGLVLAAVLIGGLFYAANHRAHRALGPGGQKIDIAAMRTAAASIKKGFVGVKRVGAWEVACRATPLMVDAKTGSPPKTDTKEASPPLPLSLDKSSRASPAASSSSQGATTTDTPKPATTPPPKTGQQTAARKVSLGRCRVTQVFTRKGVKKGNAVLMNFRIVGQKPGRLAMIVRLPRGKTGDTIILALSKQSGLKLPIANCMKAGCFAFGALAPETERNLTAAARGELILPPGPDKKRARVIVNFIGLQASLDAIRRAQS